MCHGNNNTTTFLWLLYRSTCISGHVQLRTGGFCWYRVYCPHALLTSNQHIRIMEKILEFSIVLSTLSPYAISCVNGCINTLAGDTECPTTMCDPLIIVPILSKLTLPNVDTLPVCRVCWTLLVVLLVVIFIITATNIILLQWLIIN